MNVIARLSIYLFLLFLPVSVSACAGTAQDIEMLSKLSSAQLMARAEDCYKNNKVDSALLVYNFLAERYSDRQSSADINCSVNAMAKLGNIYRVHYFNYPRAYSYLNRAVSLSRRHNISSVHSYACSCLALLYETEANSNDHVELADTVIHLLRESFNVAYEAQLWEEMLTAVYNMGVCAYSQGKIDKVKAEFDIFRRTRFPADVKAVDYIRHFCDGVEAMASGDFAKAENAFAQMNKYALTKQQRLNYYSNMAEVYYRTDRVEKAIETLDYLRGEAEKEGNKYFLMQVYGEYCTYYEKLGDAVQAGKYRLAYLEKKTEVQNNEKVRMISDMRFINQIDSINVEMKNLEQSHRTQRRVLLSLSAFAIVLVILLVCLLRAYRQLNRRNEALYLRHKESLRNEREERAHRQKLLLILHEKEQREQQDKTDSTPETDRSDAERPAKTAASTLSEERIEEIFDKVGQAMTDTDLICDEKFALKDLADAIGERQREVSQVINERYGVNFHTLLGEHRVKEACRRINEQASYDNMTIEAIAASVGIKSRSHFALTFKRITGLNPSEYIRIARSQRE